MALIACRECGKEISDKAASCPNCGALIKKPSGCGCGTLIMIGVVVFIIIGFFSSNDSSNESFREPFNQRGYFKSTANDRVFTVEMQHIVLPNEAHRYAIRRPYTAGQMTAVYFYLPGSNLPVDGITKARSLINSNRVLYDVSGLPKWRFAFLKGRNGVEIFVDCEADPRNELCRKK